MRQSGRTSTLAPPSAAEAMNRTLDAIAASDEDLVPAFFRRFFQRYPELAPRFHNRASSQGTMVNEMILMLLAEAAGEAWLPTFLRAQVSTHHRHGEIALEHFRGSLDLLVESLAEAAGSGWNAVQYAAWRGAADRLNGLITRYH